MSDYEEWYRKLPPETQQVLRAVWDSVPAGDRKSLAGLLGGIPGSADLIRSLVRISAVQFRIAFGEKHKVVIVGPANVGKSTLYNQFLQEKSQRSEVSPLPGTTRANLSSDAGLFSIVDTPGADAVGEVGEHERQLALDAAGQSDFLIIVFDAIQGVKQNELILYRLLTGLGKPYVVVLNKIDLVRRHENEVVALAARNLGLQTDQVITVSAEHGRGLDAVLRAIALAEPEIVAALGRALPQFRGQLASRAIISAASASAVIALTPLPVVDFLPLVAVQSAMVLAIARIYQYEINLKRARELVATFGLGFLGRTLFYELSKLGGIPGWMLGAAIASSTTAAMGYASIAWFAKGERLSLETLRHLTQRLTETVLGALRGLGKRQPGEKSLREKVSAVLDETIIGEIDLTAEPTPLQTDAPDDKPSI
jgi:small GTP-binding protein